MTTYVTDTHPLLWYFFMPDKLPPIVLNIFDNLGVEDLLIVPPLVIAEMVMVVEKQRIKITLDELRTVLEDLARDATYLFANLTREDVLASAALTAIPDIFDRLIVYEAYKHNVPLITRDEIITKSGLVRTIW